MCVAGCRWIGNRGLLFTSGGVGGACLAESGLSEAQRLKKARWVDVDSTDDDDAEPP